MLAAVPVVSADTIVYDNTINFLGAYYNNNGVERGDGMTLAGTDRVVTKIALMIHSNASDMSADVTVRLFERGDELGAEPGAMLWQSELFEQMAFLTGTKLYDFDVPKVTAPDSLTWTLELQNVDPPGEGLGPRLMDPPLIGSSKDFVWFHNPNGTWDQVLGHLFRNNLGARIEAVPEPGTLVLLAFAAPHLMRRRRARCRPLTNPTNDEGSDTTACWAAGVEERTCRRTS